MMHTAPPPMTMNQNQAFSPPFMRPAEACCLPMPPAFLNHSMSTRLGRRRRSRLMRISRSTPTVNSGPRKLCSVFEKLAQAENPVGPSSGISTARPNSRLRPVIDIRMNDMAVNQCSARSQARQRRTLRPESGPSSRLRPCTMWNNPRASNATAMNQGMIQATGPLRRLRQFSPPGAMRLSVV
ncbi:MAG: hypothetical protein U5K73_00640 [Halofilum sp. (in: g-proteobacteria)]|nr:hypothetical protein [Halofilum sp. (in: g-proteobacteria)]